MSDWLVKVMKHTHSCEATAGGFICVCGGGGGQGGVVKGRGRRVCE
jgi:hypothetical protein